MHPGKWIVMTAFAAGLALVSARSVPAQNPPPAPEEDTATAAEPEPAEEVQGRVEEVITVTGTRVEGRSTTDTPAPVDYIGAEAIQTTGAVETGKILQMLAPSFNFSATTISDGTDIIRPATLRALAPDQVLVLVNGKRRHQQALVNVQQTVGPRLGRLPTSTRSRSRPSTASRSCATAPPPSTAPTRSPA